MHRHRRKDGLKTYASTTNSRTENDNNHCGRQWPSWIQIIQICFFCLIDTCMSCDKFLPRGLFGGKRKKKQTVCFMLPTRPRGLVEGIYRKTSCINEVKKIKNDQIICIQDGRCLPQWLLDLRHFQAEATLDNTNNDQ